MYTLGDINAHRFMYTQVNELSHACVRNKLRIISYTIIDAITTLPLAADHANKNDISKKTKHCVSILDQTVSVRDPVIVKFGG